jgi:P-type E1-E2 ATPase
MMERQCLPDSSLLEALEHAQLLGRPIVLLGGPQGVVGCFIMAEELRPRAVETLRRLSDRHAKVCILTGDSSIPPELKNSLTGIEFRTGLLPDDKVAAIREFQSQIGLVAMVGDGVNDAPALAASDVAIALACGADVSRETADICLLGDDLVQLEQVIRIARQTVVTMRRNLFWAFAYNVVGIGFALTGQLSPVLAAVAMFASSVMVVSGAMRLAGRSAPPVTPLPRLLVQESVS